MWNESRYPFSLFRLEKNPKELIRCSVDKVSGEVGTVPHFWKNDMWYNIYRTDVEAETPILWPSDAKSWLIWKYPGAGKDWGQEEKGTTEDELVGWHRWLSGHGFGWTVGVGDGQGGLAYCSSWGCKELDMTEWLNWIELKNIYRGNFGRGWQIYRCIYSWAQKSCFWESSLKAYCQFKKHNYIIL